MSLVEQASLERPAKVSKNFRNYSVNLGRSCSTYGICPMLIWLGLLVSQELVSLRASALSCMGKLEIC